MNTFLFVLQGMLTSSPLSLEVYYNNQYRITPGAKRKQQNIDYNSL